MKRTRVKLYLSVHGGRVHSVEGAETYSVGMVTLGMGSPSLKRRVAQCLRFERS